MKPRWTLTSALVALPATLAVATAVLATQGGLTESTLTLLPSTAAVGIVGGLLAGLRPRYAGGWLLFATGLAFLIGQLAEQVAYLGLVSSPGTVAWAGEALWVTNWIYPPALVPFFVLVPLTFPDGRLPSHRWRPLVVLAVLLAVQLALFGAVGSSTLALDHRDWPNPHAITALADITPAVMSGGGLATLAASVVATASLLTRWRGADEVVRRQIIWVTLALFVMAAALTVDASVALLAPAAYPSVFPVIQIVPVVVPVAIAVSILRHQLFDIEVVFSRAVVYGLLTAMLVLVYVAIAAGAATALPGSSDTWGRLAATALVAVAFAPLRDWLQRIVGRRLFGDRAEPYAALTRLARQLEAPSPPDRVLATLAASAAQALKSPFASVELARDGALAPAVEHGRRPLDGAGLVSVDLTHGGQHVGRLVVGQRGHEALSVADLRLLADLALPIAAAVHAVHLSMDLHRSRERLVLTVEEERRRLGRDVHDSLGPHLAAISMQVETARDLVLSDPDRARSLLSDLLDQTELAVKETRRMAHTHRPPALDTLGLVPALGAHLAHLTSVPVRLNVPRALPPLPAAVEIAAYRIALEAMNNVAAHAGAQSCALTVTHDGNRLVVEVDDDGCGIPKDHSAGIGQQSMRERAEELGGSLTVGSRHSGGTTVRAVLPCGPPDLAETDSASGIREPRETPPRGLPWPA